MNVHHLIDMANQIGRFYAAMPDHTAAVADVAGHLRRFWDPRMRGEFVEHVDATGGEGLEPIVAEAVRAHRELLLTGVSVAK